MTQIQHSLTPEDQKRLSELFDSLDVDKDGRIDVNDLTEALQQLEVPVIPGQAQVVARSSLMFIFTCPIKKLRNTTITL